MRVLLVRSGPQNGGVERLLVWLARGLLAQGVDVGAVALYRRAPGRAPVPRWLTAVKALGGRVWTIPDSHPWDFSALAAFYRVVGTFRPDVVHTHDYKGDMFAWLTAREHWLPTAHGFTASDFRVRWYERLDRALLRRARTVLVPSSHGARVLARAGVEPARVRVIPHGLDWDAMDAWAAAPLPEAASAHLRQGPILTFVGRLSREKGGDAIVRVFAKIAEDHPSAHLWFVGEGARRREWQRLARGTPVAARIHFWGWRENPFPFIRASTALLLPTRGEFFGLSAVEALGLGVPVITHRTGILAQGLDALESLFLPPRGEPWDRAVRHVLARPEEIRRQARTARASVRERFPVAAMVQAHRRVYAEHLGRGR